MHAVGRSWVVPLISVFSRYADMTIDSLLIRYQALNSGKVAWVRSRNVALMGRAPEGLDRSNDNSDRPVGEFREFLARIHGPIHHRDD